MTSKHTRGPWFAGDRYTSFHVHNGDGRGICSTGGHNDNRVDGAVLETENVANAHLIAAAPDLYESLGSTPCVCPVCGGDGHETCSNPDHGFIAAMGGEIDRLGCPVCGHDENHKTNSGEKCDECKGSGDVPISQALAYCGDEFEEMLEFHDPDTTERMVAISEVLAKAEGQS